MIFTPSIGLFVLLPDLGKNVVNIGLTASSMFNVERLSVVPLVTISRTWKRSLLVGSTGWQFVRGSLSTEVRAIVAVEPVSAANHRRQ